MSIHPPAVTTPAPPASKLRVTGARVIHSEWIKFWTVRSTVVTLAVAFGLLVVIGLVASSLQDSATTVGPAAGPQPSGLDPVEAALAGRTFAQLAFGTLGVLFMAGEYSTRSIQSSLIAVPKRLPVLWAKIVVFTAVVFTTALAGSALAFTGGQALIGDGGASWSDPSVPRAVIGSAVVHAGSGVLGLALGALLRSIPAAISTLVGALFVLSGAAQLLLPESWRDDVLRFLPANAGEDFTALTRSADALGPWAALAVFLAYVGAATAGAAWRLRHADA
jgi:ABC-2 type transport system permease protein